MAATATAVLLQQRPGLLGDSTRPGVQALPRLVADAEAALEVRARLQQQQLLADARHVHNKHSVCNTPPRFTCCCCCRLGTCSWLRHACKPILQRLQTDSMLLAAQQQPTTSRQQQDQPQEQRLLTSTWSGLTLQQGSLSASSAAAARASSL